MTRPTTTLRGVREPDRCCLIVDETAREQYERVWAAIEEIQRVDSAIAWVTVSGEETRTELGQAADLLEQVAAILQRTSKREAPWFDELERLAPRQIWGDEP